MAPRDLEEPASVLPIVHPAVEQVLDRRADRGQRRTQLVRHVGHELLAQTLESLEARDVEQQDERASTADRHRAQLERTLGARKVHDGRHRGLAVERRGHVPHHDRLAHRLLEACAPRVVAQVEDRACRVVRQVQAAVGPDEQQPLAHAGDDRSQDLALALELGEPLDLSLAQPTQPARETLDLGARARHRGDDRNVRGRARALDRRGQALDRPREPAHAPVPDAQDDEHRRADGEPERGVGGSDDRVQLGERERQAHVADRIDAAGHARAVEVGYVGRARVPDRAPEAGRARARDLRTVEMVLELGQPLGRDGRISEHPPVLRDDRHTDAERRRGARSEPREIDRGTELLEGRGDLCRLGVDAVHRARTERRAQDRAGRDPERERSRERRHGHGHEATVAQPHPRLRRRYPTPTTVSIASAAGEPSFLRSWRMCTSTVRVSPGWS
jgi:hypothetical protein